MATFTMTLGDIAELVGDPAGVADDPYVAGAGSKLGLDKYPIFDESHRDVLNQKIMARYWTRENGQETVSRLVHFLRMRMNERMVMWNQLYLSTLIEFDPLATFNLKTIRDGSTGESVSRNSSTDTTGTTKSTAASATTNTPQNQLPPDWVHNADYATGGAASESETDTEGNTTGTDSTHSAGTMNDNSTTTGFQGAASDLMRKYRAQIINVDEAVVDSLADLFMGIYDSGDEMLPLDGYGYGSYALPGFPNEEFIPNLVNTYDKSLDQ